VASAWEAQVATLGAALRAELATIEAARRAELARLEAKRLAELATLEAKRLTELAAAVADAAMTERKRAETYMSHELKNCFFAILEMCFSNDDTTADIDAAKIRSIATEAIKMLVARGIMTTLASGAYGARLEDVNLVDLIETRIARIAPRNRDVVVEPIMGDAAACATMLRSDQMLLCIILDNLLSNAFKYGEEQTSPRFEICVENDGSGSADEGLCNVRVSLHNGAGPRHAELLALGDEELNRIAAAEGSSAHNTAPSSAGEGEGYPMSLTCAKKLGGFLRLHITEKSVVATLTLPRTPFVAALSTQRLERIAKLSYALVDDSAFCRKSLARVAGAMFHSPRAPPHFAGETCESIELFAQAVVDQDIDVVFVDQSFGTVCRTLMGTDVASNIRKLDLASGAERRLIIVVSANDATDDRIFYIQSGADDCLSKNRTNSSSLQELLRKHATTGFSRSGRAEA